MDIKLKYHLVEQYRESIAARYNWETLKSDKAMPKSFNRELVEELRDFFLNNLYTAPAKREKLDAAFKQLETYIAHPTKVWALMGSLPSAIMKFGFQFPAAMKAGMTALSTHTSARHFEDLLLQTAQEKEYKVPLTPEQFNDCLASLPMEDLEKFIGDLTEFFMAISDAPLLAKTIDILKDVLDRMKHKHDVFGPEDEDAIQLGVDILQKSHDLLGQYDDQMRHAIVDYVALTEKRFLQSLQAKSKKKRKKA